MALARTKTNCCLREWILMVLFLFNSLYALAQPSNDQCASASPVSISGNGFGIGSFSSSPDDVTNATIESGESFAPAILVAGQTQKSIWYRFFLPTTRSVRVTLAQSGTVISAGDIGFTVYKTNVCLPGNSQISTKLTPIALFGNTFHPCVDSGYYYVQVSAKNSANGQVYINIETDFPQNAIYDRPAQAYDFGTMAPYSRLIDYDIGCQSLEDAAENCPTLGNSSYYNKSTWHVFKTPAYFDFIGIFLNKQNGYFSGYNQLHKFGYQLYSGDVRTTAISGLSLVTACDSLQTDGSTPARKLYRCSELQPNTVYSIQLFFPMNFQQTIRLAMVAGGTAPTKAPEPILSLFPASNDFGNIVPSDNPATYTKTDQLACNAHHRLHPCSPALPADGLLMGNNRYNLSTFFTITLTQAARLQITANTGAPNYWGLSTLVRVYRQPITNDCQVFNSSSEVGAFHENGNLDCMEPGTYTIQVMGQDTLMPLNYYSSGSFNNYPQYFAGNLGTTVNLSVTVTRRVANSKFSLQSPGAVDRINMVNGVQQPLQNFVYHASQPDTVGCRNTVRPDTSQCSNNTGNKIIYRQFLIGDSSMTGINALNGSNWYRLYQGDADALATAQNMHAAPGVLTGLIPYSPCFREYNIAGNCNPPRFCLVPGTYTLATMADDQHIGSPNRPGIWAGVFQSAHGKPQNAQNMGDILNLNSASTTIDSDADYFSCYDNAVSINGYLPCTINNVQATKAIYRQFYLSKPAAVAITGEWYSYNCNYTRGGYKTLFSGKVTDGIQNLQPLGGRWNCFINSNPQHNCDILQAGWYTVVSYGIGPSYDQPMRDLNHYSFASYVGVEDKFKITATVTCPGPQYNRPYKAAIDTATQQPFLVEWGPNGGHTNAYPKTDKTYVLPTEYFNCTTDLPFSSHGFTSCPNPQNYPSNRVVYYVFKTTQESYVSIHTKSLMGTVYKGDARFDSTNFTSSAQIQPCIQSQGFIQLCRLQPGTYTLICYANDAWSCQGFSPYIYIDKVGTSRFDHANNAYDFGLVPPDSTYHYGKVGDVNPLDPGRAPSSDIIYCTTGSQISDPSNINCGIAYNANVYNAQVNNYLFSTTTNNPSRRNLWYSFVADKGGYVRVKVENKTIGKHYGYRFAVYRSDANGSLPFSTLVANGEVDSTIAQGLSFIVANPGSYYNMYCYGGGNEVSFYRNTCNPVAERYYIVIDNPWTYPDDFSGMHPNNQLDVSILIDSINAIQPKFDHYYQAGNLGVVGTGTHNGEVDNFSCATPDPTDPIYAYSYCGTKTLWYKFTSTVSGYVSYRAVINGNGQYNYTLNQIQLLRELVPGDSTSAGLQILNTSSAYYNDGTGSYWAYSCISPGTYYILLPGCGQVNEYVYPQIIIGEQKGDLCSTPVIATLGGPGTSVSPMSIDCHTIGTDYGEFNITLSCPNGGSRANYKTSWYRISLTGNDTLDVTTFLTENTNAQSSEIKYRLMTGNCGAMQEQSCVQDALTQDTYKCLPPGDYYVQVFTPYWATGTISLNLSAVKHVDTCAAMSSCLATAVFQPKYDCTQSDTVRFTNLSTYGSNVQYHWDFGYNNQTSTAVSPLFAYPVLPTSQTYTVNLKVINNGCGGRDSTSSTITIPGRPKVNLGKDTTLCSGTSYQLDATSWPGTTYVWSNGTTGPTLNLGTMNAPQTYSVAATYNGCIKRDTIKVFIDPYQSTKSDRVICNNLINLYANNNYGGGLLWSNGTTNHYTGIQTPGIYYVDHFLHGCVTRDTFVVSAAKRPFNNKDTTLCPPFQSFSVNITAPGGFNYYWPQYFTYATNFTINNPGTYIAYIQFQDCSIYDTLKVKLAPVAQTNNTNVSICSGQSYTLPWGQSVNSAGLYRDTIRSVGGCDSLIQSVNLNIASPQSQSTAATICSGDVYTLPWGRQVTEAGIYQDTMRTQGGCDSLVRSVNLSIRSAATQSIRARLCQGSSYLLPWGLTVNQAGMYRDTLRYPSGCDSLLRLVELEFLVTTQVLESVSICGPSVYTLPWGVTATTSGIYRDTIRYAGTGCDSIIKSIQLDIHSAQTQNITAGICSGETYTLPSGLATNVPGLYSDTLRHSGTGCDSLIRNIQLTVGALSTTHSQAFICAGESFYLPWGQTVTSPGIYYDTLHYSAGCDSLIRSVDLRVQQTMVQAQSTTICQGSNFILPWGQTVNQSGIYSDTIKYQQSGCDSMVRRIQLNVLNTTTEQHQVSICEGSVFSLPWGQQTGIPGTYQDTVRYVTSGCDSLIRIYQISQRTKSILNLNPVICSGSSFMLPSGTSVNVPGIYRDTLSYPSGCDSLIRIINLSVRTSIEENNSVSVCNGESYMLPWGETVSASGTYMDTIRYAGFGCDSLVRSVQLSVLPLITSTKNDTLCQGTSYTLPNGTMVTQSGTYRDTLNYPTGCDSLIRITNLVMRSTTSTISTATICQDENYTLPWGTVVSQPGTYQNTLNYPDGCDSLVQTVEILVRSNTSITLNPVICQGSSYVLPGGQSVMASGIYRDTIRYAAGCDSLRRTIYLTVIPAQQMKTTARICSDQYYTLPWGQVVNATNIYLDTLKTINGCDSLIREVNLQVSPSPFVQITKSNDVDCMTGNTQLKASGGVKYQWSPASSLSNPSSSLTTATPDKTTMYTVTVTNSDNCIKRDSILVKVSTGDAQAGYLVPSAFTPNGDGKNDCFGIRSWGQVRDLSFVVFNRWGQVVFESNNPSACWDGKFKGKIQRSEVFVYIIKANTICGPVVRKGTVTLIQ